MGLPPPPPVGSMGNKAMKKQKKSGVFNGKITKKENFNKKAFKGLEEVQSKWNKGKKKQGNRPAISVPSFNNEPKTVISQTSSSELKNEGDSNIFSKLEKKNKFQKIKKVKNADQVPETVTKVNSKTGPEKKSKKGIKTEVKEEEEEETVNETDSPVQEKKEKQKKILTKEQEEKALARRKEKVTQWEAAIDFVLSTKGITPEEAALVRRSKKYSKLPLWKKNYIAWVKTDSAYKDAKHGPLIKKVYKILKGAERKVRRVKSKAAQHSKPQSAKTQAAIQWCVELTSASDEATAPVVEKKAVEKKKGDKKVSVKHDMKGNKFEPRKEFDKSRKFVEKKKVKSSKIKQ